MKDFNKIVYTSQSIERVFMGAFRKHVKHNIDRICGWSNDWIEYTAEEEGGEHNRILRIYVLADKKCSTNKIDELLLGKFQMSKTMI